MINIDKTAVKIIVEPLWEYKRQNVFFSSKSNFHLIISEMKVKNKSWSDSPKCEIFGDIDLTQQMLNPFSSPVWVKKRSKIIFEDIFTNIFRLWVIHTNKNGNKWWMTLPDCKITFKFVEISKQRLLWCFAFKS